MTALRGLSWESAARGLLLAVTAAAPVVFYLRTYDSNMVKMTVTQAGAAAALACWAIGALESGRLQVPAAAARLLLPAALLAVWNALRFSFSGYRVASMTGFLQQEAFLAGFVLTALCFTRRDVRLLAGVALSGWAVAVLYGALQRLGLDPFIWKDAYGPGIVFSTAANPEFLAAFLALCAPWAAAAALDERLPRALRACVGACLLVSAAVAGWTGAWPQLAAFAASLAAFAATGGVCLEPRARPAARWLALVAVACALAGAAGAGSRRYRRPAAYTLETWKGAAAMIGERPLVGFGPGSFWVRYPASRRAEIIRIERKRNTQSDHAENEALEQWAEGGLVGLALWAWLWGGLLLAAWRFCRRGDPALEAPYAAAALSAAGVALLHSLGADDFRYAAQGWAFHFLAAAAPVLLTDGGGKVYAAPLPSRWMRPLAAAALLGCGWFAWRSARFVRSDIHHNIAIFHSKQKQWAEAIAHYDREVPGSPSYVMAQYFKANVLSDSGELERAVEQYRRVRALAPDYVQVHYQEGRALFQLGRYAEAIERFERQARLDPTWDANWRALAAAHERAGDAERARAANGRAEAAAAAW